MNELLRPQYEYRFMALHRASTDAVPCRLSVAAFSEKEARKILAPHFILVFAARLPVRHQNDLLMECGRHSKKNTNINEVYHDKNHN